MDDDAALFAIDVATWTSTVSPSPMPAERETFYEGRPLDGFLVAELDGVVVGYVSMTQDIPVPSHTHVLHVNGLAVDPGAQGRGVGRQLVEGVVATARRSGRTKVTLRVLGHNTTARHLYERCGFVTEGVLKGEFVLDGRLVDDVLMAYHL
ncbi:ribosomal protein S18 acetylase RimI-like enzyme [Actinophytocola oryzae]|uniref:Ribosomal protein S18 acetylase RimI-like enzyme n=2 Tax=Actinophytocola oryzae TaxID=502181 RepID=A0A4R7UX97_9PSEU|nr:GNAT family N-acetyltransferase [Actinophytocola oryzae]TDV40717.1 ribosomal protein S18 acetylase RimI-like enzyme [Actinophytocola oryzae]